MTTKQPSWNVFEAVILLEAYVATKDGLLSREDAVRNVSSDLRKMALNQGIEFDNTFRNENGISFQMHSMESAFHGKTMFKPATKLFKEAARIYHEDQNEYQKLLKEARTMIEGKKTIIDDFMQYLAKKNVSSQLSELFDCYSEIEAFCLKTKVLHKPLFETTDFETIKKVQRTIEQNKFFRITHKRQFNKILAAYRHYYLYIKNGLYHQPKSEVGNNEVMASSSLTMPIHIEMADTNSTVNQLTRTEQDERLLQKYPIIYKQVYATLKASDCALSIGILGEKISHIARPAVLEEILDNVSWGKLVGDEYAYSDEIVDHYIIINEVDAPPTKEDTHRSATQPGGFTNAGVNNTTFYQYLSQKLGMAEATCRSYTSAINNCESFAKKHGFTSWRLYTDDRSVVEETIKLLMSNESFQEYNTKQHNRHRAALQKFLAFIGSESITFSTSSLSNIVEELTSYKNEEYEAVLRQYFTKGFRLESPLEVRKFRRYYSAIHGKELPDSDDIITSNIKALSILANCNSKLQ